MSTVLRTEVPPIPTDRRVSELPEEFTGIEALGRLNSEIDKRYIELTENNSLVGRIAEFYAGNYPKINTAKNSDGSVFASAPIPVVVRTFILLEMLGYDLSKAKMLD